MDHVMSAGRPFFNVFALLLLLGRVALVAQRPIVVKLSRGRSVDLWVRTYVRASVCQSSALRKNGGSDPDAVWHHRSDGSRDEAGLGIGPRGRVLLGPNWCAPL